MPHLMETAIAVIFLVGAAWVIWQLFVLVGDMADRRGQGRLLWQVASLFISPVAAMILLWLFCDLKGE